MTSDLEYLWVLNRKDPDKWLVSLWDGEPYWLSVSGLNVQPDIAYGVGPVVRVIGNGYIGQYFRFERT